MSNIHKVGGKTRFRNAYQPELKVYADLQGVLIDDVLDEAYEKWSDFNKADRYFWRQLYSNGGQ